MEKARLINKVNGRIPCEIESANEVVRRNLRAKRDKLGHFLEQQL